MVFTSSRVPILPRIIVTFPEEERKLSKTAEDNEEENEKDEGPEWIECDEDESPKSDFEYKYGDENDNMDLKRYKRPKNAGSVGLIAVTHIKEPFLYREIVEYDLSEIKEGSSIVDQLIREEYVLPFGYPTEQYLFKLKHDVYEILTAHKEEHKNNEDDFKDFHDPGDLKSENKIVEQTFFLFTNNGFHKEYRFTARILDVLYNKFRMVLRECLELSLRLFPEYPNINLRSSTANRGSDEIPMTEISKVGLNPCLDRRIVWELHCLPNKKINMHINQMYMCDHVDIQYAFKSKISKIENKSHLVIKEDEGVRREEDFIPAETPYKKMLLFMLNRKFESFYSIRAKAEEKEQARLKKVREREEKKKKSGMVPQKSEQVSDSVVEHQISLAKQFHHLISKDGIIDDNVVSKFDVIVEANKPCLCILVIGKPRSGKTNVSKNLSEALDLVHV